MLSTMLLAAVGLTAAVDKLTLPTFLNSHMALQRAPLSARLWGWAPPNATVTAAMDAESVKATPDADGLWIVELPPQPASTGKTIIITDGTTRITLDDVAFGDVYLCSGQSNMEFSVNGAFNATLEIADSVNYPDLRLATVQRAMSDKLEPDAPSKANYTWARSSPAAFAPAGGDIFSWFSATCYFFGREVYKALGNGKVPIGLVASAFCGQSVESFSSPEALADRSCGGTLPGNAATSSSQDYPKPPGSPGLSQAARPPGLALPAEEPNPGSSQLWNAMIYPLRLMRFTGATWYQGEVNGTSRSPATRHVSRRAAPRAARAPPTQVNRADPAGY
jgi:sialate O-acetylesterase